MEHRALKSNKFITRTITLASAALIIAIDQFVKYLAAFYLAEIETFPLIENVLQLTYVENTGAAFGIFSGKVFLLVGLTGLILLGMIVLIAIGKVAHPCLLTSFVLIIGGGIGNLIDRIRLGYVIDYIHVTIIDFAVFNFADCCVVIGTILLVIYFLFFDKKPEDEEEEKED